MAKVVPAGPTFLRRMIDLSTTAHSSQEVISPSPSFSIDLEWWRAFKSPWNGRSFFLLPHWTHSPDLNLYTDSAGSIGFSAYCQGGQVDPTAAESQHSMEGTIPHCVSGIHLGGTLVYSLPPCAMRQPSSGPLHLIRHLPLSIYYVFTS